MTRGGHRLRSLYSLSCGGQENCSCVWEKQDFWILTDPEGSVRGQRAISLRRQLARGCLEKTNANQAVPLNLDFSGKCRALRAPTVVQVMWNAALLLGWCCLQASRRQNQPVGQGPGAKLGHSSHFSDIEWQGLAHIAVPSDCWWHGALANRPDPRHPANTHTPAMLRGGCSAQMRSRHKISNLSLFFLLIPPPISSALPAKAETHAALFSLSVQEQEPVAGSSESGSDS